MNESLRVRAGAVLALVVSLALAAGLVACQRPQPTPPGQTTGTPSVPPTSPSTVPTETSPSTVPTETTGSAGATGPVEVMLGKMIFDAGRTASGTVEFKGGPSGLKVAPCIACHGAGGTGGEAPNVTWPTLQKAGFTPETVGNAITKGEDEAGKPLKETMPRYELSPQDLKALVAYLQTLK